MNPPCPLQPLRDLDRTSHQFHRKLSILLNGNACQGVISSLEGEDLAWLVEYLDDVLTSISDPSSLEYKEFLRELGRICGLKQLLPKSCVRSDSPLNVRLPFAPGGTFDRSRLWVRPLRIHPNGDQQKAKETLYQVAVVWKHLNHQKIVPLLGVTTDPLQFVMDGMPGGHLTEYVANHPDANRPSLLSDVAEGLNCLHSHNLIHGDLKGSNILVDAAGHARITDFGLVVVTREPRSISSDDGYGVRWIAPEILDDQGTCSKEADIFSFAGVTIETFTGAPPFSDKLPRAAILALRNGHRPPRPAHPDLTDGLWTLTQRCWDQKPQLRPRALRVLCGLQISTLESRTYQPDSLLAPCDIPAWKCLIDRSLASDERISLITDIFSDRAEIEEVKYLHGHDAQSFVNIIDETLNTLTPLLRRKCLSALCKICGRQALLPRSVQIPLCYNRMNTPLYRGGYADVWEGEYQARKVAVKVLTVCMTSNLDKITRMFCKEVITWKTLRHQNVLPLIGVTMSRNQFMMVSEWMVNGNINEFIKKHADADRFELLKGVTRGLMYMHEEGMIHGDLKGANILIDQHGHACLADFGLTVIVSDPAYSTTSSSYATGGTTRWMSPERLNPAQFDIKDSRPTDKSDCYALGMVILEVLSGQIPFTRGCNVFMVMSQVVAGERPGRPQGTEGMWFSDDLWVMLQACWSHQPNDRPTVEAVLQCLEGVPTVRQLPHCPHCVGRDVKINTGELPAVVDSPVSAPWLPPSPSPRFLVDSSTAGLFSRGFDTITAESTGTGEPSPLPRLSPSPPPDELDMAESWQTVSRVSQASLDSLGEHLLPVEDLMRRAIDKTGMEPISAPTSLIKIVNWNGISQDIEQVLIAAFQAKDYLDCIQNLRAHGIDPGSYINTLDKVIDRLATDSDIWKQCVRALCGVCGLYGILPASHVFAGKLSRSGPRPFACGVFSNDWRAVDENQKDRVFAVKSLVVYEKDPTERIQERYCRAAVVSKRMVHPNILSIEGVAPEFFDFCMVSRWMEHGDMLGYIAKRPEVDRLRLLIGVTRGLDYLHDNEIVHGDLKSPHVFIDVEGSPRIGNFTHCWFAKNTNPVNISSPGSDCTLRWAAPERLDPSVQERGPTTMSDVYSLSMVIVELVTGKIPFPGLSDISITVGVSKGERPRKPSWFDAPGMTPDVWKIAQKCWHEKPKRRPDVRAVLQSLEGLANPDERYAKAGRLQLWQRVLSG